MEKNKIKQNALHSSMNSALQLTTGKNKKVHSLHVPDIEFIGTKQVVQKIPFLYKLWFW